MSNLMISESFVNATEGYRFGDSDWYESSYEPAELGKLYRSLVREYGRCTGKMYVDRASGETIPTGWVFVKRMEYEDSGRWGSPKIWYLRETWVSVATRVEKRIEIDYATF